MGGKLGSDFDSTKPANSSPVKQGAFWIRDLKGRIKAHLGVLMNLETGDFKDNVIRSEALRDTGVVPGTYSRLKVNSKGQAIEGFDSTEQRTARVYRAVFLPDGTGYYDTDVGATTVTGTSQTYPSDNPFSGTYAAINGSQFYAFTFTVPLNVRRLKVIQVGGGGGGDATYSGGGGQGAIYTIPVTPESSIAIYVGVGGSGGTGGGVSGSMLVLCMSKLLEVTADPDLTVLQSTVVTTPEMSECSCVMERTVPPVPAGSLDAPLCRPITGTPTAPGRRMLVLRRPARAVS